MSPEVHITSKTLAVRFNGRFSPTDRGHLAHELVRVDRVLSTLAKASIKGSTIQFNMSEEMAREHGERRERLCRQLGLSPDEKKRRKSIRGFDRKLMQAGFPYYKINI